MLEQPIDRYPRDRQQHRHGNLNGVVFCVVVLTWLTVVETETKYLERDREDLGTTRKGKRGGGRGRGLGTVTMATAFAVMAKPEVKTVRDASETHDLNASGDEHNPFDVYSHTQAAAPSKNVHVRLESLAPSSD